MGKKSKKNENKPRKFILQDNVEIEEDRLDELSESYLSDEEKQNIRDSKKSAFSFTSKAIIRKEENSDDDNLSDELAYDYSGNTNEEVGENIINFKKNDKSKNLMDLDEDIDYVDEDSEEEGEGEDEKINDVDNLKRLRESLINNFNGKFSANDLTLERMTVVSKSVVDKHLNLNDDIKRELIFYNIAHEGAIQGINMLKKEKQKINRPDDFMAEMLKSDEQMMQIKKNIKGNDDRIKKFKLREEKMLNKKFNKNTAKNKEMKNNDYKKQSKEDIERWKQSKSFYYFKILKIIPMNIISLTTM